MSGSHEDPDILSIKIKLINANYVPDSFVTSLNETYEWIWLPYSDANQLISIRNEEHVLLNMRSTLPITINDHLNFLESYSSFQRIDFVLVDKDSRQYVGGMNISQTSHGFEIGKYIGNPAYLGKRIAYQMSLSFIAFVKKHLKEINKIHAVTKIDNFKNINLNFKLGFRIIRCVEEDYWLMELK
jgi:RimJ/RimL family protein N-acetyltransferase